MSERETYTRGRSSGARRSVGPRRPRRAARALVLLIGLVAGLHSAAASRAAQRFLDRWEQVATRATAGAARATALRLDAERALARETKQLALEDSEIEGIKELVERDPGSVRVARRVQETFRRLEPRQLDLRRAEHTPALLAMTELQSRRFEVADRLFELDELWAERVAAVSSPAEAATLADSLEAARAAARTALLAERDALGDFVAVGDALRRELEARRAALNRLEVFIRGRIFWIQDAAPLGEPVLRAVPKELASLGRWAASGSWLRAHGIPSSLFFGVLTGIISLAYLVGRAVSRALRPQEDPTVLQRWGHAVGLLLAALAPPAALWIGATMAPLTDLRAELGPLVSQGFVELSMVWVVWRVGRVLLAHGGLMERELGLAGDTCATVSRATRLVLAAAGLLLVGGDFIAGLSLELVALPRLTYTVFEVVALIAVVRTTRPGTPLVRDIVGAGPRRERLARPLNLALLLYGLWVVGMDVGGYRYGAARLAHNGLLSLAGAVPLSLAHAPLTAWLTGRFAGEAEDEGHAGAVERGVSTGLLILGALVLAAVWRVDDRAIDLLDAIRLYTFNTEAGPLPVSVLDLIKALLTFIGTLWALRLLPRIYGATVFPYVVDDAGVRYAILSISRYAIFLVGLLAALSALHLDLGRLSWLMAATGVGLGFGLQEVVANFVSGVIVLMERPVRVGDYVTIGAVEGSIEKINIRATTLLDLDRKQIIVPNKDFITKEVINWTHGDPIVRLIVPIGVAYGTDVEATQALLLRVAQAEPAVLDLPGPSTHLAGHGDSSLDFELHVFFRDPRRRVALSGRLNAAVNKALVAAEIEIPFPQRDVHLRSDFRHE